MANVHRVVIPSEEHAAELHQNNCRQAAYAGIVQYPSLTELGPKRAAVTVNNICKFAHGTIPARCCFM